jgi:hypothetical protein
MPAPIGVALRSKKRIVDPICLTRKFRVELAPTDSQTYSCRAYVVACTSVIEYEERANDGS